MFNNMTPAAIIVTVGALLGLVTTYIGMRKAKLEYDATVAKLKPRQRTHQVQYQPVQKAATKPEPKYQDTSAGDGSGIILVGYLVLTASLLRVINEQAGFTTPQIMVIVMIAGSAAVVVRLTRRR